MVDDSDEDFAPTPPKFSKMTTQKNINMKNAQPLPKFNLSENEVFSPLYLFLLKNKKRALWRIYLSLIQKETLAKSNLDTYGIIYLLDKDDVKSHLLTDDLFSPQQVSKIKRSETFILLKEGNEVASSWENTYGYETGILTATALANLFYRAKEEYDKTKKKISKKVQLKPEPAPQSQLDSKLVKFLPQDLYDNSFLSKSKKSLWLLYLSKIKPVIETNINLFYYGYIYLLPNKYVVENIGSFLSHKNVADFKKRITNPDPNDHLTLNMATNWEDTYGYKHHGITNVTLYDLFNFYEEQQNAALRKQTQTKTKKNLDVGRKGQAKAQRRTKTKPIEVPEVLDSQSELQVEILFSPLDLVNQFQLPKSKQHLWLLYLSKIKPAAKTNINLGIYGLIYLLKYTYVVDTIVGEGVLTHNDVAGFKNTMNHLDPPERFEDTYGYKIHAITNEMLYDLSEFQKQQDLASSRKLELQKTKKSHKKKELGAFPHRKAIGLPSHKASRKAAPTVTPSRKAIGLPSHKASRKAAPTVTPSRKAIGLPSHKASRKAAPTVTPSRKAAPHPEESEDKPKRDYATKGMCNDIRFTIIENAKNAAGKVISAKACVRLEDANCKSWTKAENRRLVCDEVIEQKVNDKETACNNKPKIGDYEFTEHTYTNSLGKRKTALNCFKKDCAEWQQSKNGNITCKK